MGRRKRGQLRMKCITLTFNGKQIVLNMNNDEELILKIQHNMKQIIKPIKYEIDQIIETKKNISQEASDVDSEIFSQHNLPSSTISEAKVKKVESFFFDTDSELNGNESDEFFSDIDGFNI